MYKERRRTRDLLLEYHTNIVPPKPRAAGLAVAYPWSLTDFPLQTDAQTPIDPIQQNITSVYPWENSNMSILSDQLYLIAASSGYTGTKNEFKQFFGYYLERNRPEIIFDKYINFPNPGNKTQLFFDLDEKILYYWDEEYIPVNAMLIANTILEGGEA